MGEDQAETNGSANERATTSASASESDAVLSFAHETELRELRQKLRRLESMASMISTDIPLLSRTRSSTTGNRESRRSRTLTRARTSTKPAAKNDLGPNTPYGRMLKQLLKDAILEKEKDDSHPMWMPRYDEDQIEPSRIKRTLWAEIGNFLKVLRLRKAGYEGPCPSSQESISIEEIIEEINEAVYGPHHPIPTSDEIAMERESLWIDEDTDDEDSYRSVETLIEEYRRPRTSGASRSRSFLASLLDDMSKGKGKGGKGSSDSDIEDVTSLKGKGKGKERKGKDRISMFDDIMNKGKGREKGSGRSAYLERLMMKGDGKGMPFPDWMDLELEGKGKGKGKSDFGMSKGKSKGTGRASDDEEMMIGRQASDLLSFWRRRSRSRSRTPPMLS